jgi:hypothetical protein
LFPKTKTINKTKKQKKPKCTKKEKIETYYKKAKGKRE